MAACDIFWHAASDEPFGRSILEAMTLGMPIIAPNAGGAAELVTHGSSGLLFAADNVESLVGAALKMAEAPEFARACGGLACRRAAEEFSAGRMADGVIRCYNVVLGRSAE
jgi:glycosyltransferase involved in cell wall biosynthesis